MIFEDMGHNIREKRKSLGLTQEQLSEMADISAVFLSQIETANKTPSLETTYKIASALGLTMEQVFSLDLKVTRNPDARIQLLLEGRTEKEKIYILELVKVALSKMKDEKLL